jgi:hypothetical protein
MPKPRANQQMHSSKSPFAARSTRMAATLLAASSLLSGACGEDSKKATSVAISIKADSEIASVLSAVRIRVYSVKDTQLEHPVSSREVAKALLGEPVVIDKSAEDGFLLAVQAVGAGGNSDPLVEYRVRVDFEAGKMLALPVYLSGVCRDVNCEDMETTCVGDKSADECGACEDLPRPGALVEVSKKEDAADWTGKACTVPTPPPPPPAVCDSGVPAPTDGAACPNPAPKPELDCGVGIPAPTDGAACPEPVTCEPSIKGAKCDLVSQCGCDAGEKCELKAAPGTTSLTPTCVADLGTSAPYGDCDGDTDCPAQYVCIEPGLCIPYCNMEADCGKAVKSKCDTVVDTVGKVIAGVHICAAVCSKDTDCLSNDMFCNPTDNTCVAKPKPGGACNDTSGCAGAAKCITEGTATTGICHDPCTKGIDCNSGCCQILASGNAYCFEEKECAPAASLGCSSNTSGYFSDCLTTSDCCSTTTQRATCVNMGTPSKVVNMCAPNCTTGADCGTLGTFCCVPLASNLGNVCQPAALAQTRGWSCL